MFAAYNTKSFVSEANLISKNLCKTIKSEMLMRMWKRGCTVYTNVTLFEQNINWKKECQFGFPFHVVLPKQD